MSAGKHTPGPWRVVIDDDGNPLSGRPGVFAADYLDCGIVHWDGFVQPYWRSARGDKEIHANARLIAAAPDFADNAPRAIEMLRVAAAFIREHDPDGIAHYDEAVCDGYCIADDCESAADTLQGALAKAKGGDA